MAAAMLALMLAAVAALGLDPPPRHLPCGFHPELRPRFHFLPADGWMNGVGLTLAAASLSSAPAVPACSLAADSLIIPTAAACPRRPQRAVSRSQDRSLPSLLPGQHQRHMQPEPLGTWRQPILGPTLVRHALGARGEPRSVGVDAPSGCDQPLG